MLEDRDAHSLPSHHSRLQQFLPLRRDEPIRLKRTSPDDDIKASRVRRAFLVDALACFKMPDRNVPLQRIGALLRAPGS